MRKVVICGLLIMASMAVAQEGVKHRFFKCGWGSGGPGIYNEDFEQEWFLEDKRETSDGWLLQDGTLAYSFSARGKGGYRSGMILLGPDRKQLWEYVVPDGNDNHSCFPLPHGGFLLGECGKKGLWMTELDKHGKLIKRVQLCEGPIRDIHHAFRQVRKTPQGTYVATLMGGGSTRELPAGTYEWDGDGKILRKLPGGFYVAVPLPNGNIIVSVGNGKKGQRGMVEEYDKDGKKVWEWTIEDVEKAGIRMSMACGVQRLSNGNTVITNVRHGKANGPADGPFPWAIEVTHDKKVVWMIPEKKAKGNMGSLQILDAKGDPRKFELQR